MDNFSMILVDRETGKEIDMGTISDVSIDSKTDIEMSSYFQPNISLSVDNVDFSPEAMSIFSDSHDYDSVEVSGYYTYYEQARRHRKKRINKKWARRYGLREVHMPVTFKMEDCVASTNGDTFDISGKVAFT